MNYGCRITIEDTSLNLFVNSKYKITIFSIPSIILLSQIRRYSYAYIMS